MEYLQYGYCVIGWKWTLSQLDALSTNVNHCAIELLQFHSATAFNYVCFIFYQVVSILQNLSAYTLDGYASTIQKSGKVLRKM